MATFGTPHEGVDNILINAYTGLQLILYINAFDSLDRDTVLADLVQPSNVDSDTNPNGYGPITLSGVWSSTGSVITYDHGTPDNPIFQNTGQSENWDICRGAAITDGTYIFHFKDFGAERDLEVGQQLEIDVSSMVP